MYDEHAKVRFIHIYSMRLRQNAPVRLSQHPTAPNSSPIAVRLLFDASADNENEYKIQIFA